jgi:hypothetical protein
MKDGTLLTVGTSDLSKVDAENIECAYFGGYPGDQVKDSETLGKLAEASFKNNGTTVLEGIRYNRVNYKYPDGTTEYIYFVNTAIKWRVIGRENGVLTFITEKVIDFEPIKKESEKSSWSDSKLANWLKTNFISIAFSDKEKRLLKETPYILKQSELTDEIKAIGTGCSDYAKMGFNFGNSSYMNPVSAEWWLRPEDNSVLTEYSFVAPDGSIGTSKVGDTERKGVRPVIRIKF